MSAVPVENICECQDQFLESMRNTHKDTIDKLASGQLLDDDINVIKEVMTNVTAQYK